MKKLIEGDARYTLRDIVQYVGITSAAAHKILTERLGLTCRKLCGCWVSHFANKGTKGLPCKELLTGDETWIYFFESPRKISNKVWIDKARNRPNIAKYSQSAKKFFMLFSSIPAALCCK